ncbi:MAG: 30S ribosomal protein S7 [Elusimicrobiota bacterium]
MPRKSLKPKEKRPFPASDTKYDSQTVSRFINKLNFRGKRTLAERIIYMVFDSIKEKIKEEPLKVFLQAIENVRPLLVVKARRVGGATYQVPTEVPQARSESIAMRWILQFARERKGMPIHQKLAEEIISAYRKEGSAIKKREDTHKMAEANKAFAHYRW